MRPVRLFLLAVEASADELGAGLMAALRARLGEGVRFTGVGGAAMARQGFASAFEVRDLAILGAWEGIAAYPRIRDRLSRLMALARAQKPDAAILIDAWGLSQRLAARLAVLRPRPLLIKYVAPQVWASRPGRARVLARRVDRLLAINPFDAPFFERAGLPTRFVGNPAAVLDFGHADPQALRAALGIGRDEPVLLILPGSRPSEIARMMEPFGEAAGRLARSHPQLKMLIAPAPEVAAEVRERLRRWTAPVHPVEGRADCFAAMRAATVALACSGTVTTQLAAAGAPMVVGYRLGTLTHQAAKVLVTTPWVTLLNVAARRFVVPELIQNACTGEALAREVALRLDNPDLGRRQAQAQADALEVLRGGIADPGAAAAQAVIDALVEAGTLDRTAAGDRAGT